MKRAAGLLAILGLLPAGCATSRFVEADAALRQIEDAEEAGARAKDYEALRIAKASVEFAREAEERALDDLEEAREDLEDARRRESSAVIRHQRKESELGRIGAALAAAKTELAAVEERERALRGRGLTEREVFNAAGATTALERLRVEGLVSSKATLEKEIDLAGLERKDAAVHIRAAEARRASAEQRLRVARALYDQAEQQAKIAEAEAIAAERIRIGARLGSM